MRTLLIALAVLAVAAPTAATQTATPQPPAAPQPAIAAPPAPAPAVAPPMPQTRPTPATPPQAPVPPRTRPVAAQAAPPAPARAEVVPTQNVRVELAISDGTAAGQTPPSRKVVTILIADGLSGRVRSSNQVLMNGNYYPITINVDATAKVRPESRVQLQMSFEYTPDISLTGTGTTSGGTTPRPASITESIAVLVPDGKPTLISQSADPATDRKVSVEVTATIVR